MLTRGRLNSNDEESESFDDPEIRIGIDYQAALPAFKSKNFAKDDERTLYEVGLWYPVTDNNKEQQVNEFIRLATLKHRYSEEQALALLKWHSFDFNAATEDLSNFKPVQDQWSLKDKRLFFFTLENSKKQFSIVQKVFPKKSLKDLILFYYLHKRKMEIKFDLHIHQSKWKNLYSNGIIRPPSNLPFLKDLLRRHTRNEINKPFSIEDISSIEGIDPLDLDIARYLDKTCALNSKSSKEFIALNCKKVSHPRIFSPRKRLFSSTQELIQRKSSIYDNSVISISESEDDVETIDSNLIKADKKTINFDHLDYWMTQRIGSSPLISKCPNSNLTTKFNIFDSCELSRLQADAEISNTTKSIKSLPKGNVSHVPLSSRLRSSALMSETCDSPPAMLIKLKNRPISVPILPMDLNIEVDSSDVVCVIDIPENLHDYLDQNSEKINPVLETVKKSSKSTRPLPNGVYFNFEDFKRFSEDLHHKNEHDISVNISSSSQHSQNRTSRIQQKNNNLRAPSPLSKALLNLESSSSKMIKEIKRKRPNLPPFYSFWSKVDEELLVDAISKYGLDYEKISERILTKTPHDVALYIETHRQDIMIEDLIELPKSPIHNLPYSESDEMQSSPSTSVSEKSTIDLDKAIYNEFIPNLICPPLTIYP